MNIYDYQAAFGAADKTGRAMRQAMELWKKLYYQQPATEDADPCQRIAYTVVSKILRAVFAEYTAGTTDPVAQGWLEELNRNKERAMEMTLSGGECYIKPYPNGAGFSYTLIPRANILIFGRDGRGEPCDVGLAERLKLGKSFYTLLERRYVESGILTIENTLYRSFSEERLGQSVPLKSCARYRNLPALWHCPMDHLGLVRLKSPTINCVDGSQDPVAVFAPACGLIAAIDENEAQLSGEFRRGQSRVFVSRDLLDGNKELRDTIFVGLDEDPQTVGITQFAPQLREQSYLARKQEYLRNIESVVGLKRGMLSEVNNLQRTATEINASEADFSLTVMDFQNAWERCARQVLALCRMLAGILGMETAADIQATFDWGNGVLFDEEKIWADYMAMAEKGLIAPEVALGWRFGMPSGTKEQRMAIRRRFMPDKEEEM